MLSSRLAEQRRFRPASPAPPWLHPLSSGAGQARNRSAGRGAALLWRRRGTAPGSRRALAGRGWRWGRGALWGGGAA